MRISDLSSDVCSSDLSWPSSLSFPPLGLSLGKRELELLQKRARFVIGFRSGGDNDVHPPHLVDLVVVDLREHDVFAKAHGVVAATVERGGPPAAELLRSEERRVGEECVSTCRY